MKTKKTIAALVSAAVLSASVSGMCAFAAETGQYGINVNNQAIQEDICVMVPVRAVAEAMGYSVQWDGTVQGAKLEKGENEYWLLTNEPNEQGITAVLMEDTLYVSVDFFYVIGENDISISFVNPSTPPSSKKTVQEHETVAALSQAVGYEIKLPEVPDGFKISLIEQIGTDEANIVFENGDTSISYAVMHSDDPAHIAPEYALVTDALIGNKPVKLVGNERIDTILWKIGDYSYSLFCSQNVTETELMNMVKNIVTDSDVPVLGGKKVTTEYQSMDELSEAAGYAIPLPSVSKEFSMTSMTLAGTDEVSIIFQKGESCILYTITNVNDKVSVRSNNEVTTTVKVENTIINLSGVEMISNISWTDGTYVYSVYLSEGIDKDAAVDLAKTVINR